MTSPATKMNPSRAPRASRLPFWFSDYVPGIILTIIVFGGLGMMKACNSQETPKAPAPKTAPARR